MRSRRCTSAHTKAPDGPGSQRSGPASSRRRPLLLRSGGWARKYLRGSRTVLRDFTSNVRTVRPDIYGSYFLSGIAIEQDPTGGTLRSSVVHSPCRAWINPLAWLATLTITPRFYNIIASSPDRAHTHAYDVCFDPFVTITPRFENIFASSPDRTHTHTYYACDSFVTITPRFYNIVA